MKTWTVESIMQEEPCDDYPIEKVKEIFGDRETLTTLEILKIDTIPAVDRIWVVTRKGAVPERILKTWCNMTADRAVRKSALTCGIPDVESWAEKWLSGEDRSEKVAALAPAEAGWVAALAAARVAAWAEERQQQVDDLILLLEGDN